MRKSIFQFFFVILLLIATSPGTSATTTITNYHEGLDETISTSNHGFAPTGWGHIVDYLKASGWGSDTYVTYTYKSSGGQTGGYIYAGSQTIYDDDYNQKNCCDLLVTPAVKGTVSFYVKKANSYSTPSLKLYKCTTTDGKNYTKGDEIALDNVTVGIDWSKVTITVDESTYIGIYLSYCAFDEFTASEAQIPDIRTLQITSTTGVSPSTLYANAAGQVEVSGKMKIKNVGNITFNPGDENYSVSLIDYSKKTVLATLVPTFSLAPNEESEDILLTGTYTLADPATDARLRVDAQENISGTTKMIGSWIDICAYTAKMGIIYNNSNYDSSKPINLGMFKGAATVPLKLENKGGAPLSLNAITLPQGYSLSKIKTFPYEIGSGVILEDTLTIDKGQGVIDGEIKFEFVGTGTNKMSFTGCQIKADSYFEDFESNKIPAGWIVSSGSNWKAASVPSASSTTTNKYCLSNSLINPFTDIISPKLKYAEGDSLIFYSAKQSSSSGLIAYYSTDRTEWTQLMEISTSSSAANQFASSTGVFKAYQVAMPAGEYYLKFSAGYAYLDNVIGGTLVAVDHDMMFTKVDAPTKGMINTPINVAVSLQNVNAVEEPANSYTVSLYANDALVAKCDGEALAAGETKTYELSYIPHTTDSVKLSVKAKINNSDYEVYQTVSDSVAVSKELAVNEVSVGELNSFDSTYPLKLNNKNSISEIIYKAADLDITSGTNITSISYPYYKTTDTFNHNISLWLQNTSDEAVDIDKKELSDTTAMTRVYLATTTIEKGGSASDAHKIELKFDAPFEYTGENLRLIIRSEASGYKSAYFGKDNTKERNILLFTSDASTYKTSASPSTSSTAFPVIYLATEKTVVPTQGTIVEATKKLPIEGAEIKLTSGEVEYSALTDAEGKFTLNVIQSDKDYSYTITKAGYDTIAGDIFNFAAESYNYEMNFNNEESTLNVKVTSVTNSNLSGLTVKLSNPAIGLEYSDAILGSDGTCSFTGVVNGYNTLSIDGSSLGFEKYKNESVVVAGDTQLDIVLNEAMRTPYALEATLNHDNKTGKNSLSMGWNQEKDFFFDDFESYEPFSISFSPWTGYDGDKAATAQIQGSYPNSQLPQYATIFNPLTINPPVWYDYPVLRPYSGKQYAAFIRTDSGVANNDWLITPKIKVGVDNVVSFMAKAGDVKKENFRVAISTTGTDIANFKSLTQGNYESVDYKGWKEISYDLSDYEGQDVYLAINCVSKAAFMLMVDDFYVGPASAIEMTKSLKAKSLRVGPMSASNPNEKFEIYLDGNKVAETESTNYTLDDITPGEHTVGVKAVYLVSSTELSTMNVTVPASDAYTDITINVAANNEKSLDGVSVNYVNKTTGEAISDAIVEGKSHFASLPNGTYLLNITADGYDDYNSSIALSGTATSCDILMKETISAPSNLYAENETNNDDSTTKLYWNQDMGFTDSFETYPDFTQQPGDWKTIDGDGMPTYGISFNGTTISIPGFATNDKLGAMVFNPLTTIPSLATDAAMIAPDGDKSIMFKSAQGAKSDDWLISPLQEIKPNYVMRFYAKSYSSDYPETFEIGIITDRDDTNTFVALDRITPSSSEWTQYELDLTNYANQNVCVAFHYISNDAFLAHIDNVYVGPADKSTTASSVNVIKYNVYLDDALVASTTSTTYDLGKITGPHTASVEAVYKTGTSDKATINFNIVSSVDAAIASQVKVYATNHSINVTTDQAQGTVTIYNVAGSLVASRTIINTTTSIPVEAGMYAVTVSNLQGKSTHKVIVK